MESGTATVVERGFCHPRGGGLLDFSRKSETLHVERDGLSCLSYLMTDVD